MNIVPRILLTCAFLIGCGIAADSTQAQIACPVPPPSPFRHNALIATRYDQAMSTMRTVLEHPRMLSTITRGGGSKLYLAASFVHSGWTTPLSIELTLISASSAVQYRDSNTVTILIEGRPHQFMSRYLTAPSNNGEIYEAVRATLMHRDLLEINNSRGVSVRVGANEFALTENHLEALRELASLMQPENANESDPFTSGDGRTR